MAVMASEGICMKGRWIVLVLAVLVGLPVAAQPAPSPADEAAAEPRRFAALDRPVSLDLDETPADAALRRWAREARIGLIIDWEQLERHGFHRRQPLSLTLHAVTAGTALRQITDKLFPGSQVTVTATPETVRIGLAEPLTDRSMTRVYGLDALSHLDPGPAPPTAAGATAGAASADESAEPPADASLAAPALAERRARRIARHIRRHVQPEIWEANGGKAGSIIYHDRRLIVRAPVNVHRQIGIGRLIGNAPLVASPPRIEPADRNATPRPTRTFAADPAPPPPGYLLTDEHGRPLPNPTASAPGVLLPMRQQYGGAFEYRRGMVGRSNGVSGIDWTQ